MHYRSAVDIQTNRSEKKRKQMTCDLLPIMSWQLSDSQGNPVGTILDMLLRICEYDIKGFQFRWFLVQLAGKVKSSCSSYFFFTVDFGLA